jgi:thiosulfate reductase cytochrome b subunit
MLYSELLKSKIMSDKIYLYPVWIRLWHVANAILFIILIATGIAMQYANPDNNFSLISFSNAVSWHNVAALILTPSYVFYVLGNVISGNGRFYKIRRKGFIKDLGTQFKYYASGMFKEEPHPFPVSEEVKFNPLQKFAYVVAMYICLPLVIISGMGLFFPEIVIGKFLGMSGLLLTAVLHVAMGFILSIFMIVHIYTCTLGRKPTSLFKGMVNGYHEAH